MPDTLSKSKLQLQFLGSCAMGQRKRNPSGLPRCPPPCRQAPPAGSGRAVGRVGFDGAVLCSPAALPCLVFEWVGLHLWTFLDCGVSWGQQSRTCHFRTSTVSMLAKPHPPLRINTRRLSDQHPSSPFAHMLPPLAFLPHPAVIFSQARGWCPMKFFRLFPKETKTKKEGCWVPQTSMSCPIL